ASGVARLRHALGAQAVDADRRRRRARPARGRLPGREHGAQDGVRGALRRGVRGRARADHQRRAAGRGDRRRRRFLGGLTRRGGGVSWAVRVVRNRYVDSVKLMRIAKDLRAHGRAEVAMGTPANLETLTALGVTCDAGPTDIVIAVEGPEE